MVVSYIGNLPAARISSGVEQPNFFYNYTDITSDGTSAVSSGYNGFLKGTIIVASGVTWTIDGTLTIL